MSLEMMGALGCWFSSFSHANAPFSHDLADLNTKSHVDE